jgi:Uma2 family endonuclease
MTETAAPTPELRMSEDEFERWCGEDTRAEFIDGRVVLMPPVSLVHNRVTRFLTRLIDGYLDLRPSGELLGPEFQVRLRAGLRRVPDLLYVSAEHAERVTPTILEGPPDIAWEVVSLDSVERDWREKYLEYQASGVPEYWVIDPLYRKAQIYALAEDGYQAAPEQDGRLVSAVLPGFWLKTTWLWESPLPKPVDCLREIAPGDR